MLPRTRRDRNPISQIIDPIYTILHMELAAGEEKQQLELVAGGPADGRGPPPGEGQANGQALVRFAWEQVTYVSARVERAAVKNAATDCKLKVVTGIAVALSLILVIVAGVAYQDCVRSPFTRGTPTHPPLFPLSFDRT